MEDMKKSMCEDAEPKVSAAGMSFNGSEREMSVEEIPGNDKVPPMHLITAPAASYPVRTMYSPYKHEMKLKRHRPEDFSDLGQAGIFVSEYGDIVRWAAGIGFLVYNGRLWVESEEEARRHMQRLTEIQYSEAKRERILAERQKQSAEEQNNKFAVANAKDMYSDAVEWFKYVLGRRNTQKISNALKESQPMLSVPVETLDKDPFFLNTPTGTVNLRTGELMSFNPADMCTKITGVGPDHANYELFGEFLSKLTCGDTGMESYLQEVVGMCAIGKVYTECLVICQGAGGNGKSTFWNLILKVLGDYGIVLQSDVLTDKYGVNRDVFNGMLRGRRLAVYPELGEGLSLDMGQVKKISSTDDISVNPKYEDPYKFKPSHTPVLYTNPLPTVKARDKGTWDRLILVPFRAQFRGATGEIKNYADFLFEKCGGAVLSWIIEGAKRFIANEFKLNPPECVRDATELYHQESDWFRKFTQAACEIGEEFKIKAQDLLDGYGEYCKACGESRHNPKEVATAYKAAGFVAKRGSGGNVVYGLRLKERIGFIQVDMETPFDQDDDRPY